LTATVGKGLTSTPGAQALTIAPGEYVTLNWSSLNAVSCTALSTNGVAVDNWVGEQATSGNKTVGPVSKTTDLSLECTGLAGKGAQAVSVTVAESAGSPVENKKVGGGAIDPYLVSGLLLMLWVSARSRRMHAVGCRSRG
jgi:hypothetical protein